MAVAVGLFWLLSFLFSSIAAFMATVCARIAAAVSGSLPEAGLGDGGRGRIGESLSEAGGEAGGGCRVHGGGVGGERAGAELADAPGALRDGVSPGRQFGHPGAAGVVIYLPPR